MKSSLAEQVADQIESHIPKRFASQLPTAVKLAKEYGVSYTTARVALNILKQRGVITKGHKRLIIKEGEVENQEPKQGKATTRLRTTILQNILDGVWIRGSVIPKAILLAQEMNAGLTTVTSVLKGLEKTNHIHKKGRSWIVGKRSNQNLIVSPSLRPTIFLHCVSLNDWKAFEQPRIRKFRQDFERECSHYRVSIEIVLSNKDGTDVLGTPAGPEKIRNRIKNLGSRFLGTVIIRTDTGNDQPSLYQWFQFYNKTKKPVVWFDRHNKTHFIRGNRSVFRCHFAQTAGYRLMLDAISISGHERIAFPFYDNIEWQVQRAEEIDRLIGSDYSSDIQFVKTNRGANTRVVDIDSITLQNRVKEILRGDYPTLKNIVRPWKNEKFGLQTKVSLDNRQDDRFLTVASWYHALSRILKQKVTCILCPNDYYAFFILWWLTSAGLKIPENLSLLSFDNNPVQNQARINSLDFGFGDLGYSAFHLIHGSVPIKADRNGNVPAKPYIADYGSFAPRV